MKSVQIRSYYWSVFSCIRSEYGDFYSDTSGSLWQFERDEVPNNNSDLTIDNSQSCKYKAALVGKTADAVNNTTSSVRTQK